MPGQGSQCMKVSKATGQCEIDFEQSFQCMKHSGLKVETEGLITQVCNRRHYHKHIMKQDATDKCRMCHSQPETVEHIISGYQTLH